MTFNQIEYFLAVAKHLNYSAAAKSCYTSQPNLSRQISALENELGYLLFARDHHKVVLTSAGKTFLAYADRIWTEYQRALKALDLLTTNDKIRFGVLFGIQILLDALNHLIRSHKFPSIEIFHLGKKEFLSNDTIDIGFCLMQDGPRPYSMPLTTFHAPLLIPKDIFPDSPPSCVEEILTYTFLLPEKELFNVQQELEKRSIIINYQYFQNPVFDFESYLLNLKFNNYIGYKVNDNLKNYENDFWIVDFPELTLNLLIGVQWAPEKDELCRKVALALTKYIKDNA